jgi:hypothetical protein
MTDCKNAAMNDVQTAAHEPVCNCVAIDTGIQKLHP